MNRVKKDYCNKNRHPKWKAWTVKYGVTGYCWDMNNLYPVTNGNLGAFCDYCDSKLNDYVAWGHEKNPRL